MKMKLLMLTAAVTCALAGNVVAMTKTEYTTQKNQISADYKASREKCNETKGNAKDICVSEVKGREKVARAELEAQYTPSPRSNQNVAIVKADSAYDTAKEKCDDLTGNAKDVCVKEAKATHVKAIEDSKVVKASADTSKDKAEKMNDVQKDASAAKRDADFNTAKARCDSMAAVLKDICISDAKAKFGM